jgi:two-component system, OmpR family, sensor kinase
VSRLPIRLRLTAAFVVVMALLLAATGVFVHRRQAGDLNRAIDAGLRSRAQEIATLLDATGGSLEPVRQGLVQHAADIGQVIDGHGKAFDLTRGTHERGLLIAPQLATARTRAVYVTTSALTAAGSRLRVYAKPHAVEEHRLVLVVASSLTTRDSTLASLTRELLIGGIGALLIAGLSGFAVASAALRPVEAMRARAETISDLQPGERLPEPRASDEMGRLARTLNEMLDRLEAVLAHERAFVADASHELRTPLTVLRTELDLALSQPRSVAELEASIRSAGEETEQLAALADDLLMLARSDSNGLATARRAIDVHELLTRARDQAGGRDVASGREILVRDTGPQAVRGDLDALQRALVNLLDNALRHGAGAVVLSAQSRPGAVEIEVRDEGVELEAAFAGHAFERFARAPSARSRPGTGLGLAIVQAIARAHDGSAGIAPAANGGSGTRAWITLPAATDRT